MKGTGAGITFPLQTVDVWGGGRQPAIFSNWSVYEVDVAPGYAAAVAGAGLGERVPKAPHKLDLPI